MRRKEKDAWWEAGTGWQVGTGARMSVCGARNSGACAAPHASWEIREYLFHFFLIMIHYFKTN